MIDPATLTDDAAREIAANAVADGGCIDCRFRALAEWAPGIDWPALRREAEKEAPSYVDEP